MSEERSRRIGIVGYGHIGMYLVDQILQEGPQYHLELAFVWNRSMEKMDGKVAPHLQLHDLSEFAKRHADLIVEVAHPCITRDYGERFLSTADFLGLKITMTKHPNSFKLKGQLVELNQQALNGRAVLYEGPVRSLCHLAPNNVNTMAAGCMAAHTLGFDSVIGALVADPSIPDWHIVDIEVTGPTNEKTGQVFTVKISRCNPAAPSSVTGSATFISFWSSLLACKGHGGRVYLC
ncbi:aspartate dehydrogenase domain-containing protein isoform X2 [Ascaphus truei]|uniref:aspartate dehydrogenase domain-containing protein isoform X2 n=1 Tax=Ascaphus truei TaxID=8439 RepID=UPI003F5A54FC